METLREELNLPVIGGELVAHFTRRFASKRMQLGSDEDPYFEHYYVYDFFIEEYYRHKMELSRIIKQLKEFNKLDVVNIFEFYIKKYQLNSEQNSKHQKIEQYFVQAKAKLFDEEMISELLQIVYELDSQNGSQEIRSSLDRVKHITREYKEELRRINIRLKGIHKAFADKSEYVLKQIEKKSHNYSLSMWDFRGQPIIDDAFKSEPEKLYCGSWYLYINFDGPDRRYLDGSVVVDREDLTSLITDLETALEKMQSLKKIEFSGLFTKTIRNSDPTLEIFSESQSIGLKFWVKSKNHSYYKTIDLLNLEKIIKELKQVEDKGKKLALTLEALCF